MKRNIAAALDLRLVREGEVRIQQDSHSRRSQQISGILLVCVCVVNALEGRHATRSESYPAVMDCVLHLLFVALRLRSYQKHI